MQQTTNSNPSIGDTVKIGFGLLRGKFGEIVKIEGRQATVRTSAGVTSVLLSQLVAA